MKRKMSTKPVTDTLPNMSIFLIGEFHSISSCNLSSVNQYNYNCKVSKSSPIIHRQSELSEVLFLQSFIVT